MKHREIHEGPTCGNVKTRGRLIFQVSFMEPSAVHPLPNSPNVFGPGAATTADDRRTGPDPVATGQAEVHQNYPEL